MTRRAVYTIRDCDDCVRYVGSSHWPEVRFAGHAAAKNDFGRFLRRQHAEGKQTRVVVEEWFASDEEGFAAEKLYIQGYSRLLGKKLFNVVRHVIEEHDGSHCIHCEKSPKTRGLCGFHWNLFDRQLHRIPAKGRAAFDERCVKLGLILEQEESQETIGFEDVCDSVLKEFGLPDMSDRYFDPDSVVTEVLPKRLGRLSNPVSIEVELTARQKRQALLTRSAAKE